MPAVVVALVTVVVVAAADGATAKLKPLAVAEVAVADGAVDDTVAEANGGVEADDEANEKAGVLAEELPALLALENNEGAEAACEEAKEKPVEGVDAGVAEVAGVLLLGNEKAEPVEAENREGVVFAAVVEAAEPGDEVAAVAGETEMPNDGAVVAEAAGDEAVAELKSGAEVVDPNSDEPVAAPKLRAGEDAGVEVEAVLDAAAPELSEKANVGVEAAAVAAVEPDAGVPNPKPVAEPEKRLGVDAAEEAAAPNRFGVVAAVEVAPNKPGVVAGGEVAPNRLGVDPAAGVAPNGLGVVATVEGAPNGLGVVVAEPVVDTPKGLEELAAAEAAPNKLGVAPAEEAGFAPKRDGADAAEDCPNEKPVDPKLKGDGEEAVLEADAAADGAPNREEPNVGAEEAALDEAPNGEEPKAGAGEDAAAGCEAEKPEGVVEKKGEEAEEPAAAEPPKLKGDAMVGAA